MSDTKITKGRIHHHFSYSWWKYALLFAVAVFGWNMIYTMTKYQAPPDKRLGVYFVTHPIDTDALDRLSNDILSAMPRLEDVNCVSIVFSEADDYYATIQLTTYIGAGEGDIYIMNRQQFHRYAPGGAFLALDEAVTTGAIHADGISLQSGYATVEDADARALYGIPATELYGFLDYGIDNRDLFICVMAYGKNKDSAVECVDWLMRAMKAPKPEWVEKVEAEPLWGERIEIEDYPSY